MIIDATSVAGNKRKYRAVFISEDRPMRSVFEYWNVQHQEWRQVNNYDLKLRLFDTFTKQP